jgi:hypothetical protein
VTLVRRTFGCHGHWAFWSIFAVAVSISFFGPSVPRARFAQIQLRITSAKTASCMNRETCQAVEADRDS